MFTMKVKIGKGMLEHQTNDMKSIHRWMAIYGALPEVCSCCKSDDIYLSHKAPKGNDYYTLTCKSCGAELTFHQKKEGGFYIKYDDVMTKYQKTNESQQADPYKEDDNIAF